MKQLAALLAALMALATFFFPRSVPRPPNIVLILVDTLRRDHLPFYGYAQQTAPFLSQLAARGSVFENAYSTSAWTPPAAASLFTSLYPFQHGVQKGLMLAQRQERLTGAKLRLNRLPRAAETIPEALSKRGYSSWAVTQNPNLSEEMGFDQGFTGFTNSPKSLLAAEISARLDRLRPQILAQEPYFLYIHYMDVHGPYRERPPFFDASLEGDARRVSAYDSGIFTVDDQIRRSFEAFGWDQALVVVTADHGEELGERGQFGHGTTLFAELVDIPLVVSLPGSRAKHRVFDPVSLVDVLPTLREAAGLPPSPGDAGVSLLPLLAGSTRALPPRPLFAHLWRGRGRGDRDLVLRATIEAGWKRIGGGTEGTLLYDRQSDPYDQRNRSRERPEIAAALQRSYQSFEARCRKLPPETRAVDLDSEAVENLKALGYVQ